MKSWLVTLLISAAFQPCPAETYDVIAPTRGPIGGPADTATLMPFLIKYAFLSSMRYQQIYAASSFTNVPKNALILLRLLS